MPLRPAVKKNRMTYKMTMIDTIMLSSHNIRYFSTAKYIKYNIIKHQFVKQDNLNIIIYILQRYNVLVSLHIYLIAIIEVFRKENH